MKKAFKDFNEKVDPLDLSGTGRRELFVTSRTQAAHEAALAKKQEESDKLASDKEKQNKITQDEELEQARRNAISETMRKEGAPTSNRRFLKGAK